FYNIRPTVFADEQGQESLMAATAQNKVRVRSLLATIGADGGTDHMKALRAALALRPEVIFFLTDADLMKTEEAREIKAEAGATRIQCIEFGIGPDPGTSVPLRTLA